MDLFQNARIFCQLFCMQTFVDIPTETWNQLMDKLLKQGWKAVYRYDAFDAGIDFDLVVLKKGEARLYMGWTNWFEGEIQGEEESLCKVESVASQKLRRGSPEALKPEVIDLYRRKFRF